jgi:3-oxoacyl-[acyl-carrier-protein] synthase-1
MSQPVFVTGYGIITSIGTNTEENLNALLHNQTGYGQLDFLETIHRDTIRACEIKKTDQQLRELAGVAEGIGFTRTSTLGLIAATEAMRKAGLSKNDLLDAAFISATTTGGVREFEKFYYELQDLKQSGIFEQYAGTANPGEHAERIANYLSIKKYVSVISTACSSSANSIMSGAQLIKNGLVDMAVCGGTEVLSKFTLNGFNSLMILDKEHCRPFDKTRNGLNLGEGAAYVVLESEESVKRSGKKPLAELKGFGNANDAFHQTASSPNGDGAWQAMNLALQSGNTKPSDIQYINAHGTGTENNDLSEGLAIQRLFGQHVPLFSSTKPFVGHTLAAAGAIEAIFSILALQGEVIFPNLNFNMPMDEFSIRPAMEQASVKGLKNVLSNSFGFGGNTSSLLLSKV